MPTGMSARRPTAGRTSADRYQQGWRNTAQNLNLNRDYMKADAPEMQAMLGLIAQIRSGFLHRPARHGRHGLPVRHYLRLRWLGRALCRQPGDREVAERRLSPEGRCGAQGERAHTGAADLRTRRERPFEGDRSQRVRAALQPRLWRPAAPADRAGGEPLAEAISPARAGDVCAARGDAEAHWPAMAKD